MYSESPKSKRFEFRCPDPSTNGYLTFSAIMMAALDGIENKIDPGQPLDKNTYELSDKEKKKITSVPGTLKETLEALEKDCKFLTKGEVFTDDLIETYIKYKIDNELNEIALRPHPHEFHLYYDN